MVGGVEGNGEAGQDRAEEGAQEKGAGGQRVGERQPDEQGGER